MRNYWITFCQMRWKLSSPSNLLEVRRSPLEQSFGGSILTEMEKYHTQSSSSLWSLKSDFNWQRFYDYEIPMYILLWQFHILKFTKWSLKSLSEDTSASRPGSVWSSQSPDTESLPDSRPLLFLTHTHKWQNDKLLSPHLDLPPRSTPAPARE